MVAFLGTVHIFSLDIIVVRIEFSFPVLSLSLSLSFFNGVIRLFYRDFWSISICSIFYLKTAVLSDTGRLVGHTMETKL
ncbi:hypothetical protein P175DRAFT_0375054 [Aspergillus ochraceoroseus IBT 24754]|uniref:Uncharacterized protein n=1 Tax=Aspergillus ochraceoroseus IBT 24754 TaxID=1392256 RepID=A0A2T5LN52_9EURO|nr:uncharacterized protein P175DRAFT_0375054 [Aspergillus ochraceoroseus IBT 24754]PTU17712.1 hypothetical protein P175DRAFT_0375054 [Aspergillus ochraceoroseus IBT 24754]